MASNPTAVRRLVRRNMGISAAINAAFSTVFFLFVFGVPGPLLAWNAPDNLAIDFLPQSVMVSLMSALVPALVERKALSALPSKAPLARVAICLVPMRVTCVTPQATRSAPTLSSDSGEHETGQHQQELWGGTQSVYDSPTGRLLLIPQGSRLIGESESKVAAGERRALLAWDRLILPDSRSISFERLPGTGASCYASLQDRVNYHWGNMLLRFRASRCGHAACDQQQ